MEITLFLLIPRIKKGPEDILRNSDIAMELEVEFPVAGNGAAAECLGKVKRLVGLGKQSLPFNAV